MSRFEVRLEWVFQQLFPSFRIQLLMSLVFCHYIFWKQSGPTSLWTETSSLYGNMQQCLSSSLVTDREEQPAVPQFQEKLSLIPRPSLILCLQKQSSWKINERSNLLTTLASPVHQSSLHNNGSSSWLKWVAEAPGIPGDDYGSISPSWEKRVTSLSDLMRFSHEKCWWINGIGRIKRGNSLFYGF